MGNEQSSPSSTRESLDERYEVRKALGLPGRRFKPTKTYERSRSLLGGHTLKRIYKKMDPMRFRFIDCAAFLHEDELRIISSDSDSILNSVKYATVSYPWKGSRPVGSDFVSRSFAVEGAEDADRISLDVLHTICAASVQLLIRYIWIDRLCMLQTIKVDVDWQIENMALIYRKCSACLIIPGGLARIAGFKDQTSWIYRSWTLQEALLPPEAWCLFRWERPEGFIEINEEEDEMLYKVRNSEIDKDLRERGGSVTLSSVGMLSLSTALTLCAREGSFKFTPCDSRRGEYLDNFVLFSKEREPIKGLIAATKARESTKRRELFSERIGAVTARGLPQEAMEELRDAKNELARLEAEKAAMKATEQTAIWRCAMMRTSTKEVDVVYSIMGLFGVTLTRSEYPTQRKALIALCQGILRNGGSAHWFGASLVFPASATGSFCTMPAMPISTSTGPPYVTVSGKRELAYTMIGPIDTYLDGVPTGTLSDDGFMKFTAPVSPVTIHSISKKRTTVTRPEQGVSYEFFGGIAKARIVGGDYIEYGLQPYCFGCLSQTTETTRQYSEEIAVAGEVGTHAVDIGRAQPYASFYEDTMHYPDLHWLMLIKRHANADGNPTVERWHKTGMATVTSAIIAGWERKKIQVGGIEEADRQKISLSFGE